MRNMFHHDGTFVSSWWKLSLIVMKLQQLLYKTNCRIPLYINAVSQETLIAYACSKHWYNEVWAIDCSKTDSIDTVSLILLTQWIWIYESNHRRSSQASLYLFLSRFSFLIYTLLYLLPLVKCRDYGIFAVWTFLGKLSGGFYGFLVRMASVCSLPLPTSSCDVWSMRNILIMPMRSCTIERP